ncbi:glycosyl hydrolase [Sphingobacterium corticis]
MFAEPPMFYAPHTFWFWDDTIRNENTPAVMAEEMIKQRLNPGYVHPRSSMNRGDARLPSLPFEQYLEAPWFNSFRNALDKAASAGFTLGYCDEYDWPSGQAAGRVLEQRPDLEAQHLDWKRTVVHAGKSVSYDSIDFAVAGRLIDGKLDGSTLKLLGEKKVSWKVPKGEWVVYTYTKKFHAGFDGGRVNYLHHELAETFIPLVHERYEQEVGAQMGKAIPGVFVDHEGDYGWHIAWSDYLAKLYHMKKNRDMRLWLPMLTEQDRDGLYVKARNDWFEVVTDAYINCFFEPVVDWLAKRDMYAISNLWEESLQLQTSMVGDLMKVTRAITMPGNDCLIMKSQKIHDFKEVQSVAEFEDRPFMSEIMGVAGWEQTPQMMKMTVNAVTSFGVSHIVPHGINLNRKLETIPFPADWYTENPFWPYLHNWTDFARRSSFVTRQTQLAADVLLYHPLESIWGEAEGMFHYPEGGFHDQNNKIWSDLSREVNETYSDAMEHLDQNHIEFLIADRHYLENANIGTSKDGKTTISINKHELSAIVLPPISVISKGAAKKVVDFAQAGGVVVILGQLATGSPQVGKNDPAIAELMHQLRNCSKVIDLSKAAEDRERLAQELHRTVGVDMSFDDAGRLYTSHRKLGETHFYWIANNTDSTKCIDSWLRDGKGTPEIWNCETGAVDTVHSSIENNGNSMSLTLKPYEAYWVVFNAEKPLSTSGMWESSLSKEKSKGISNIEIQLTTPWKISYVDSDTIYCTSAIAWHGLNDIIDFEAFLKRTNGTPGQRSSFIRGSLERIDRSHEPIKRESIELEGGKASCWQLTIPLGATSIVFPSEMNGLRVWVDHQDVLISNKPVQLPPNSKQLTFAISDSAQLPTTPIAFKVNKVNTAHLDSWYGYGLDEYTGYLEYETNIKIDGNHEKLLLALGKVSYMAEVFVNGKSLGAKLWPPYDFDLSNAVKEGLNTVKIRVGNLMVNRMSLMDDLGQLRTWSWGFSPEPDLDNFAAGLFGPVEVVTLD